MIVISEEELKEIPSIDEELLSLNKKVYLKFYLPSTNKKWFVTQAKKQANNDIIFFGLVHNDYYVDWEYFSLSELNKEISVYNDVVRIDIDIEDLYINRLNNVFKLRVEPPAGVLCE